MSKLTGGFRGTYVSQRGGGSPPTPFPIVESPLNIYVAPTGDDANSGLTPLDPVLTYPGAWSKALPFLAASITVHVARFPDSAPIEWVPVPGFVALNADAQVIVIGDGAGQPGEDGFDVVATGVCAAGSSAVQVVPSVPVVADAFEHAFLEITSGPADGGVRTVRNNTTGAIIPSSALSAVPAVGNTFRIVTPATFNDASAAPVLCEGAINLTLVNLEFMGGVTFDVINMPMVKFFGVRFAEDCSIAIQQSMLAAGVADVAASDPFLLRLPELWTALGFVGDWDGWGVVGLGNLCTTACDRFVGFANSADVTGLNGDNVTVRGDILWMGGTLHGLEAVAAEITTYAPASPQVLPRLGTVPGDPDFGADVYACEWIDYSGFVQTTGGVGMYGGLYNFISFVSGAAGVYADGGAVCTFGASTQVTALLVKDAQVTWDTDYAGAVAMSVSGIVQVHDGGHFSVKGFDATSTLTISQPDPTEPTLSVLNGGLFAFGAATCSITGTTLAVSCLGGRIEGEADLTITGDSLALVMDGGVIMSSADITCAVNDGTSCAILRTGAQLSCINLDVQGGEMTLASSAIALGNSLAVATRLRLADGSRINAAEAVTAGGKIQVLNGSQLSARAVETTSAEFPALEANEGRIDALVRIEAESVIALSGAALNVSTEPGLIVTDGELLLTAGAVCNAAAVDLTNTGGKTARVSTGAALNVGTGASSFTASTDGIDCTGGGTCTLADTSAITMACGGVELIVGPNVVTEQSSLAAALPSPGASFSNTGGGVSITRAA